MKKIIYIYLIFLNIIIFSEENLVKRALVKIYTSHQKHDYLSPWQRGENFNSTATGFIIKENKIITNAHAVLNAKFLQVRKEGDVKKYKGIVKFISEEYDLAMLEVEDKEFYRNTSQLKLGKLPEIQENVVVYGYPLGGDKLSTTKGIVSRLEHNTYTLTPKKYLIGQTDAAINYGNSGGPVLSGKLVVGVAFSGLSQADNIGYFIPVNILEHFIEDIKDGKYDGAPELGIETGRLESLAHRKMLGIERDSKGILIKSIYKNSPFENVFQKNDVLLKLDGKDIEYDGTVEFRKNEKTDFSYINQQKNYGDEITYEIIRNKKLLTGKIKLDKKNIRKSMVKNVSLEHIPTYFIYGGLVFEPLTSNYLIITSSNVSREIEKIYDDYDEVVVLIKVLPYDINLGYSDLTHILITKVNGEKYKNFKDFILKIKKVKKGFITFETENEDEIVLDVEEVEAQKEKLLNNYNISSDISEDLEK